jgi:hypothetical protein
MGKLINLAGARFNRLTAIKPVQHRSRLAWECACDCGNRTVVEPYPLKHGIVKSCGCVHRETAAQRGREKRTHGQSETRAYRIWCGIKQRCLNEDNPGYADYGGRGIDMCESWQNSFEVFIRDMGWPAANESIERLDNSRGYSAENCRWATQKEQTRNHRRNRIISFNGEIRCLAAWAEANGIPYDRLHRRLGLGWDFERALKEAA